MNKYDFYPDFESKPPEKETYRSIFKWGDPKRFKHPNKRLYAMLKKEFQMQDADFTRKLNEGCKKVVLTLKNKTINLTPQQINEFKEIVGDENINSDDYSRVKYASGKTMEEAINLRNCIPYNIPGLVVHPRNKEDVKEIVVYCNKEKIPIYVYSGGSSVNLGFQAVESGITLVMSTHMNRFIELNEINHTATIEAGIMGLCYEDFLNNAPERLNAKRRYTCGHFPQSFEYSSVGGWIVTLGSGQQSSYYGDMYDIVLSQEYVTPAGCFRTLNYPAAATGPKINDIMKGSEGTYGVLVSATLKVFKYMPENRKRFSFIFPTWEKAVDASRQIFQGEFGNPSLFRISDPEETDVVLKLYGIERTILDKFINFRGFKPSKRSLCIAHTEGENSFSKNVKKRIIKICKEYGGMYLTGFPVRQWEKGRFTDPYIRESLHDFGIIIDTLETSVVWDNLHNVYKTVRNFIKSRPKTISMTHASHFYPQGTNLYFIFMARISDFKEYKSFQNGVIDQISKSGGSLSHHHGVGKMISPWMENHLGKEQMSILRAIKKHLDPNNIMNPGGTMGLDI